MDMNINQKAMRILKSLLIAYLSSGIMMVLLALMLCKMSLTEAKVAIGIMVIYTISSFLAGFVGGKYMKVKKYLWGLALGLIYFVILMLVSMVINGTLVDTDIVTSLVLCMVSGTLGGMLS